MFRLHIIITGTSRNTSQLMNTIKCLITTAQQCASGGSAVTTTNCYISNLDLASTEFSMSVLLTATATAPGLKYCRDIIAEHTPAFKWWTTRQSKALCLLNKTCLSKIRMPIWCRWQQGSSVKAQLINNSRVVTTRQNTSYTCQKWQTKEVLSGTPCSLHSWTPSNESQILCHHKQDTSTSHRRTSLAFERCQHQLQPFEVSPEDKLLTSIMSSNPSINQNSFI